MRESYRQRCCPLRKRRARYLRPSSRISIPIANGITNSHMQANRRGAEQLVSPASVTGNVRI